jgi:uncharacterized peroxidase-related enzyme
MLAEYQLTLTPKTLDDANPEARALLENAKAQVGFIPNMYARMANSPGLFATYLDGYTRFRQQSGFTPVEQEVVFLTISRENGCEYCMGAHSVIADAMSRVPTAVTDALRDGAPIPDVKLAALNQFVRIMVVERGLPSRAEVDRFFSAGYSERHILEIVLAIAVKTLSNYANHLFHTPLDEVFAARAWKD